MITDTDACFFMDVDAADLAVMDDYDQRADARYRAACERDARELLVPDE